MDKYIYSHICFWQEWNHAFKGLLHDATRELCLAVYDWSRDGPHHFLGWSLPNPGTQNIST